MRTWGKRLRGAFGMGLIWAALGVAIGGIIELLDNILPAGLPMASRIDMWPQTLAIPGFIGGLIFAVVLIIAGGRTRLDELSMPRFTAWGAVAGLLLGGIALTIGAPIGFLGITSLLGAAAASSYLLLARRAERHELLDTRRAEEATSAIRMHSSPQSPRAIGGSTGRPSFPEAPRNSTVGAARTPPVSTERIASTE